MQQLFSSIRLRHVPLRLEIHRYCRPEKDEGLVSREGGRCGGTELSSRVFGKVGLSLLLDNGGGVGKLERKERNIVGMHKGRPELKNIS